MDKDFAKKILRNHKIQLLEILPLERELFLASLDVAELLPNGSGADIRAKSTRNKKVSYFLEEIVIPGADVFLPKLIDVMEKSDDLAVKKLAKDMKGQMKPGSK